MVQTTETQPGAAQNQERFTFAAPEWSGESGPLTEEDDYSGPVSGGDELRSTSISYTYTSGYVSDEDIHVTRSAQNGAPAKTRETDIQANIFGSKTLESDYDWGGGLLREVTTTLETVNSVANLPTEVVVSNGSTTVADTKYGYDSVGNLDSIGRVNGSATLTTSMVTAPNGNITSITAPNGAVTTISYATSAPGCPGPRGFGLFPTSVQYPIAGLATSAAWNCTGGVETSSTDLNGHATTYSYSGNTWRPASITDPANDTAYITYPSGSAPDVAESAMTFNSGNSIADTRTIVDGLGRPIFTQRRQSPTSANYDTVETEYDALGRAAAVSQPFVATSSPGVGSGSNWTTTVYDALSRPLSVTDAAGGYVDYTYAANDVLVTRDPAAANSPLVQKEEQFDALGRLTSVCELTSASGSVACGQTVAQTGYLTSYARSASGAITGVTQGAESRSFYFDELGRLIEEVNPETGTTNYYYGASPACPAQTGALAERHDNAGNVTCYTHDALERVTAISYQTVSPFVATPAKTFVYDAATVGGQAMTNVAGRLAEAYTGSRATDLGLSYGLLGHATSALQQVGGGAWLTVAESYYPNGVVASLRAPGVPTINYGLDGEGRPTTVSASTGQSPVTVAAYSALGLTSFTLGSGDSGSYAYDAATGRRSGYSFTAAGAADTAQLGWNANGTPASLAISDAIPGASDNGLNCAYSHDSLGRVSEANCGSYYDETFSWDQWGNHNSGNTPSGLVTNFNFSGNHNQIGGASYDADGDLQSDPLLGGTTNQFDAEGRPVSLWGVAATFDVLGREAEAGGEMVLYAPNGAKLGVMSGSTVEDVEIPLPGGGAAVYNAAGLDLYRSANWLGSAALTTTPAGGLASTDQYTPFGFDVTGAGAGYRSFSGQHQWTDANHTGGQYDFMYREYNAEQGRWWTPDPAGLAAVNPSNPQSWNEYAYVDGTPLSATDPLGLDAWCTAAGCGQSGQTVNVNGFPGLGMLLGGPSGNRGPGGCIVENRNPNGGRGHIVSAVYRPGERPRLEYVSAPDCGGGYYRGSGGGGWRSGPVSQPHPPAPSLWTRFKGWASSELACTDKLADKVSIAGGLHKLGIGNGGGVGTLITNALAGNILSGFIEAAQHHSRAESAALLAGAGAGLGVLRGGPVQEGVGGEAMKYAARAAWSSVTGAGETITTLAGEASLASAGVTASQFADGVGEVKVGYDVLSFAYAAFACAGR